MAPEQPTERARAEKPFWYLGRPSIPVSALALSFSALLVPVLATLFVPGRADDFGVLLWLVSLLPAFLLAFYRGWHGVTRALAAGMAVLVMVQLLLLFLGRTVGNWPLLVGVTVAYVGIALAVGFLSELLHRERIRAEQLALTDELTEIPNRRYVRLYLEREFAAAQRGRPLPVVFFDLDRFKQYNDRYGHHAGDEALRVFARVLHGQTRSMNLSGRYGGEEFVSVLSSCEVAGALIFVDRVKARFRDAELPHGSLTVSAGVASWHPDMTTPEDLLREADALLYEAKRGAGDAVRVQEPARNAAPPAT